MMRHTDVRRIAISTLSPVHIGCDEVFEPTNFVISDGLLHVLDPADIATSLDDKEKAHLMRLADEGDPIGPIQQFFKARRLRLVGVARQTIDVAADIARDYEDKAGQPQQKGGDGRPIYNLFPIARTAYNQLDGLPYLPGSSIKGAIRTAWLSKLNRGEAPQEEERKNAGKLQQRLLGYQTGKFEHDPFRLVHVADAHPSQDELPPPTRVTYAVSKKKRPSERGSPELKVFLESIREAQGAAFGGELRLHANGTIRWNALCDACNDFYWPKLVDELDHPQFQPLLASDWRSLISALIGNELDELRKARQGFLLRIGRHSGAESVTLDGVRSIKILGAKNEKPSFRPHTTEKRFASSTRAANTALLPFGWVWVDASDDAHGHLAIAVTQQLHRFAGPIRDAQRARLNALDECRASRAMSEREAIRRTAETTAAAQAEAKARVAREAALAAMTANGRRIEEFRSQCETRALQLGPNKEALNGNLHNRARQLTADALAGADWTPEEKLALANMLSEWLPKLVAKLDKDQLKKLKLADLRSA